MPHAITCRDLLRQLIDVLMEGKKGLERRDLLDELLHMVACKAAVKAGDLLAPAEVTELLSQRHLFRDTHHCPHGRPTALAFSREELDRRTEDLHSGRVQGIPADEVLARLRERYP